VVGSALTVTTSLKSICTSCSSPGHGQGRTLERLSTLDEPRLVEDLPDRACGPGQTETAEAQGFIARQTRQQTIRWLAWLARQMAQSKQTEFSVKQIRLFWRPDNRSWQAYHHLVILATELLFALIAALVGRGIGEMIGWLVGGLAVGWMIGGPMSIKVMNNQPSEDFHWLVTSIQRGLVFEFSLALATGLGAALSTWLIVALILRFIFMMGSGLIFMIVTGLIVGLISGCGTFLLLLPIGLRIRHGMGSFLTLMLAIGLITGLIVSLIFGLVIGLIAGLITGGCIGYIYMESRIMEHRNVFISLVIALVITLLAGMGSGVASRLVGSLGAGLIGILVIGFRVDYRTRLTTAYWWSDWRIVLYAGQRIVLHTQWLFDWCSSCWTNRWSDCRANFRANDKRSCLYPACCSALVSLLDSIYTLELQSLSQLHY
jgi:hypothetical protein